MKTIILSVLIIALTTLLVTAFSSTSANKSGNTQSAKVIQVIIIGHRMTGQQTINYDEQRLAEQQSAP